MNSKLPVMRIDVDTKGAGKPTLVSTQYLVFGNAPDPVKSGMVKVVAGHEYEVRLTPYGMLGSSAQVTGQFASG